MLLARLRLHAFRWSARLAVPLYAALLAARAPIDDDTPPPITMRRPARYTAASIEVSIQFFDRSLDPSLMVETGDGIAGSRTSSMRERPKRSTQ